MRDCYASLNRTTIGEPLVVGGRIRKAVIQKLLDQQRNACYVLITCGEPSEEGKMEVELTYEGDQDLAAYLIESAHERICISAEDGLGEELGI